MSDPSALPALDITRDPEVIEGYLRDASNTRGRAEALARPRSAEEVAELVTFCQARAIPLTVTARRSSTTGSPVPEGGWLLSTERLNRVLALDEAEGGVLLGDYQRQVEAAGWLFPPDPTSRDESALGATLACNASGARSFRYGPTRPWVEALEVVLPTGELRWVDRGTPIPAAWPRPTWTEPAVKTASGFYPADNLFDLIIGSEGTLGVITRAKLRLTALPARVVALIAFFPDLERTLAFVALARRGAARPGIAAEAGALNPRAIEYFDHHALDMVKSRVPDIPAAAAHALYVEIEALPEDERGGEGEGDLLERWFDALTLAGALAEDTIVAEDELGQRRLRAVRHAVPAGVGELVAKNGMPKVGTDFAVPDGALAEMMAAYAAVDLPHVCFGHIGDNHLHLNLFPRSPSELAHARALYRELALKAVSLGGTVSAEHGIGKLKRALLAEMVGPETLNAMTALKQAADPAWILGRGTLFAAPVLA